MSKWIPFNLDRLHECSKVRQRDGDKWKIKTWEFDTIEEKITFHFSLSKIVYNSNGRYNTTNEHHRLDIIEIKLKKEFR